MEEETATVALERVAAVAGLAARVMTVVVATVEGLRVAVASEAETRAAAGAAAAGEEVEV